ncbi:MAG: RsmE family RNA methyltransferase [Clostridia bacterium]
MERCVVKLDSKVANKKIERWQKIAEAAAKQSKRNSICKINNIINIKNICNVVQNYDILLVPYENEEKNTLKETLKIIENKENLNIAIVIGPEGGFEEKEIELLKQNNGKIITLGKRILRTETVAMAMASIIMYEFGELE